MTIPAIQQRLRACFPRETDVQTVRAVREGVLLADDLIKNTPLLATLIGQDYRGLIRRAGVMFTFHEACARGDLPFRATIRQMHRGWWHMLEIASDGARAQICRSEEADAFPADTPVKQDERLTNQWDLFEPHPPLHVLLSRIPSLYVWLTFGADIRGELTHVCWGAPAKRQKEWLGFSNVLRSAGSIEATTPSGPKPDPKSKMRFRDHVQSALDKKPNQKS